MLPAAILVATVAFVVLCRAYWSRSPRPASPVLVTVAALALLGILTLFAASGRLPWPAALFMGLVPFAGRWFGRRRPDDSGPRPAASGMALDRAYALLGLDDGASAEEVIAAHRRLMQKLHPDRGGTTLLAQELNEAKRVLLRHLQSRT